MLHIFQGQRKAKATTTGPGLPTNAKPTADTSQNGECMPHLQKQHAADKMTMMEWKWWLIFSFIRVVSRVQNLSTQKTNMNWALCSWESLRHRQIIQTYWGCLYTNKKILSTKTGRPKLNHHSCTHAYREEAPHNTNTLNKAFWMWVTWHWPINKLVIIFQVDQTPANSLQCWLEGQRACYQALN